MGLVQILAAFDWNIEIEDFTKLLLGLDYAEFLTGKEDEIEEFILSFIRETCGTTYCYDYKTS